MMKSALALVAAAMTAATAQAANATVVTGLHDSLVAAPARVFGRCPVTVNFRGTIVVQGRYNGVPAEIGYQFTRSDGATSQNQYIETHGPGVYHINETWTLGGGSLRDYAGWEKFKAWPTDSQQNHTGTTFSNEAHFRMVCR